MHLATRTSRWPAPQANSCQYLHLHHAASAFYSQQQLMLMPALPQAPHRILTRLPQHTLLGPALAVLLRVVAWRAAGVGTIAVWVSCTAQHSSALGLAGRGRGEV